MPKVPEIRNDYDPPDSHKKLIEMVYKRYYKMRDAPDRQEATKKWDKAAKQWDSYREPKVDWQSNHIVPLVPAIVETALAEMVVLTSSIPAPCSGVGCAR